MESKPCHDCMNNWGGLPVRSKESKYGDSKGKMRPSVTEEEG